MLQMIGFALAATFAGVVVAQQTARPQPADAKAAIPALRYHSAFQDYRPHVEPQIAPWREVNEEMARLGGHAGHMPQAARQEKSAPKPPAHSGHGGHK
ncbi:MAG TPA: hypothetical protein VFX67_03285 [Burkholderiales bacterium]|nr:hypothetical protein [Burkholderiales bacterium]